MQEPNVGMVCASKGLHMSNQIIEVDGYKVQNGRIISPGKFENEPSFAPRRIVGSLALCNAFANAFYHAAKAKGFNEAQAAQATSNIN